MTLPLYLGENYVTSLKHQMQWHTCIWKIHYIHVWKWKNLKVWRNTHMFWILLNPFSTIQLPINGEEIVCNICIVCIIILINAKLHISYRRFIVFLRRQQNVTLGSLITYLLQEEIMMKSLASTMDSSMTLFVNKKFAQNHMKRTPFFENTQQDGGDLTKN